jgi:hypothetical protein
MLIYNFDPATGQYINSSIADISPMEPNVHLIPANAVAIAPPNTSANKAAIINAQHTIWTLVDDFVGTEYWMEDGTYHIITDLDVTPPINSLTEKPLPSLLSVKEQKISSLDALCKAEIISGFNSSALGALHTYPSKAEDQTNLIGSVASGLATIHFWCADSNGNWSMAEHTLAQITQVLADAAVQRVAYSVKLVGLIADVYAASTVAEVDAIVW